MLSHTIATPATISTTAMMNMASLISTTKEFAENSCNSVPSGTHSIKKNNNNYEEKQTKKEGLVTNDI